MNITYVQDDARTKFQSIDQEFATSKYYVEMSPSVKTHHKGATLGTFMICIKCIFLQKMLHLILGFIFGVWV
jgi:hypothetical protein